MLPKAVSSTSHISFDERDKTFRLYAGNSIYSFCISPELTLEHLHWGESLPPGYDLRYLSQSSRQTHFTTVEAAPDKFGGKIVLAAETLEEIQKTWKENKVWSDIVKNEMSDIERIQKRRLENYSWRIMSKILQDNAKESKNHSEVVDHVENGKQEGFKLKNLKNYFPSLSKESSILESKALDLERKPSKTKMKGKNHFNISNSFSIGDGTDVEGDNDSPPCPSSALVNGVKGMTPFLHSHTKKKFHYIPSEANLLSHYNQCEEETLRKHSTILPKPKFIEYLQNKNALLTATKHQKRPQTFDRAIGKIGKGGICVEYSDFGTGDFRSPSFQVIDNFNGSSIAPLRYRKHRIYKGKLTMPDSMPSIRCINDNEASTLVVTMADIISGIDVDLIYGKTGAVLFSSFSFLTDGFHCFSWLLSSLLLCCLSLSVSIYLSFLLSFTISFFSLFPLCLLVCMHDYDVITRRAVFRNVDQRSSCSYPPMLSASSAKEDYACGANKVLMKASSATVDFEAEASSFYCTQLTGSWGRERYVCESKLTQGNLSFGSMRGVSSHQHNPFVAISFGSPNETTGEVRGFSLVYSGNFLIEAEPSELGRLRVNIGIHPMGLQWNLRQS
jgi:hypothetical protein